MLSKNIKFKNFNKKINNRKLKNDLKKILSENNETLNSLRPTYKNHYNRNLIKKYKKKKKKKISYPLLVWVAL